MHKVKSSGKHKSQKRPTVTVPLVRVTDSMDQAQPEVPRKVSEGDIGTCGRW